MKRKLENTEKPQKYESVKEKYENQGKSVKGKSEKRGKAVKDDTEGDKKQKTGEKRRKVEKIIK